MKFVAFIIFIASVQVSQGILFCFTCTYTDQKRCTVANNLPSENCADPTDFKIPSAAVCVKTINPHAANNKKYDRGCRITKIGVDFCTDYMADNKDSKCYSCDSELCNGANENLVKLWMFLIALIIVMYMKHNQYYAD